MSGRSLPGLRGLYSERWTRQVASKRDNSSQFKRCGGDGKKVVAVRLSRGLRVGGVGNGGWSVWGGGEPVIPEADAVNDPGGFEWATRRLNGMSWVTLRP